MTHLYTLLVGGTVIPGGDQPDVSAIAWAEDTVLLLGSDDDVQAISRGDSHLVDLRGAVVVPLGEPAPVRPRTGRSGRSPSSVVGASSGAFPPHRD